MEIVKKIRPSDKDIIEAIRIRTSECFGALNMANAMAGYETNAWYLIRNYSLEELKTEAISRGLNSIIMVEDKIKKELPPPPPKRIIKEDIQIRRKKGAVKNGTTQDNTRRRNKSSK